MQEFKGDEHWESTIGISNLENFGGIDTIDSNKVLTGAVWEENEIIGRKEKGLKTFIFSFLSLCQDTSIKIFFYGKLTPMENLFQPRWQDNLGRKFH